MKNVKIDDFIKTVNKYNPYRQSVKELMEAIANLKAALEGTKAEDYIDFSSLPSVPLERRGLDDREALPIWAMDYNGDCLVGEACDDIMSYTEIITL